jgi:hypothetical protein
VGHVGLVPSRATWTGGFKAVAKTADEALKLLEEVRAYERAGAFAVEIEVVPHEVATEISRRVGILLWSMGAGAGCDAQYLFANDLLGYTEGHVPRHSKAYRDFAAEHARLQAERTAAFAEYKADVDAGAYPEERPPGGDGPDRAGETAGGARPRLKRPATGERTPARPPEEETDMQRRIMLEASVIALASIALAAPLAAQDGMAMGYTAIDLTNPYFIALTDGMQARGRRLGIALTIHDGKSDPASQVSAIENFVVQQMDAILVSPIDPQALEPLVEQVHGADIPLISVAQGVPGSDAFLGLDEREYGLSIGRIAGQYIVDNMGGKAEVAILTYPS